VKGDVWLPLSMGLTGDVGSLRNGSLIDRAETGVAIWLVVEARDVLREMPPAAAARLLPLVG
jgi:hypothetical protein